MISEVYNIDCMSYMATCKDKQFSLAIVDPPYGIGMGGGKLGNSKKDYKQFSGLDTEIPNQEYFTELFRISNNQIIWGGNYMIKYLYPTSCFIVWDKVQPEVFTLAMCELAWTSFNSPAKIYKQRIVGADEIRIAPTQKPVQLYKWLLKNYAKPGDTIFDSHAGSMSSVIACIDGGFPITACELDKDYYEAGKKRVMNHMAQLDCFIERPEIIWK